METGFFIRALSIVADVKPDGLFVIIAAVSKCPRAFVLITILMLISA